MRISGTYRFAAERKRVWEMLLSADTLATCIPGCQNLEPTGDDAYAVVMRVGVAAVRGTYSGSVTLADKDYLQSYRMIVQGRGGGGGVRGEGVLRFEDDGGGTIVSIEGDAQVTGVVARVGQRLMGNASRLLMNRFFDCLKEKVESG